MRDRMLRRGLTAIVLAFLLTVVVAQVQASPTFEPEPSVVAPTYRVFATREGLVGRMTANGHWIKPMDRFVALPCWCALSPRGTGKFSVRLTYNGRTTVVPVWDVGPWNTRDDYWSPNRRYGDLPVGRPMAHAAYFDGYNGGLDERGRRVGNPNGIDIADGTFWEDLGMTRNDYVEVSFLWLGDDPGPGENMVVGPTLFTDEGEYDPVMMNAGAVNVDNTDRRFVRSGVHWYEETCGVGRTHTFTWSTNDPAKATSSARWTAPDLAPGFYEVKAYIPECGRAATSSARYQIEHAGATTVVQLDQAAATGQWASLGTYYFGGASNPVPSVSLSDLTTERLRVVRFDTLSFEPRNDTTAPDVQIVETGNVAGGWLVRFGGQDDVSGIAAYELQVRSLPNGGWTDWVKDYTELQAWFGPHEGRNFAFRVRARDWAGNVTPWEQIPEWQTQLP
jgi:hypothetical protein